ncbi:MAG: DUF692 domain-containing protein [Proteobacteria bacterium]|nr:DUF692 domain-containing protein [Pseudomonadota bacterium]
MSDLVARSAGDHAPRRADVPSAPVGVGFKPVHWNAIAADRRFDGFFEVHAENYMGAGGLPHHMLTALRRDHPLSLHGVAMSLGGSDPLDARHLARFRSLVERYEPFLVSEHLAWSSHGPTYFNDLLPVAYTTATLARVCEHIDQVQEAIGRPLLLENPATYVAFASSAMSECDFITAIARRTGCGLLLDLNNVHVSATNHGYRARDYLAAFPLDRVRQVHVAGHAMRDDASGLPLLVDSHDAPVAADVWALLADVVARGVRVPVLVEWDSEIPAWQVLREQAARAAAHLAVEMPTCAMA